MDFEEERNGIHRWRLRRRLEGNIKERETDVERRMRRKEKASV